MIRSATVEDAAVLADIYNYYVTESVATFEEEPITAAEMRSRLEGVLEAGLPWFVAEDDGRIVGYAYAAKWNKRSAYRRTVEVTIYLANDVVAKGMGTRLYEKLFAQLRVKSYRIAIGGITLPNPASVAIHEKFGMKKVGHFENVGLKQGQWLDVGYWQVDLDD